MLDDEVEGLASDPQIRGCLALLGDVAARLNVLKHEALCLI